MEDNDADTEGIECYDTAGCDGACTECFMWPEMVAAGAAAD